MIAFLCYDAQGNTGRTIATPSGWTLITRMMLSNGDQALEVFGRTAAASEPGAYNFLTSPSFTTNIVAAMLRVSGADWTRYASGQTLGTSGATSHPTPYIDSPVNGLLIVVAGGSNGSTWTPPSGMTEVLDFDSFVSFATMGVNTQAVTKGDIGVKTAVSANSNVDLVIWMVLPSVDGRYFFASAFMAATRTGSFTANAWFNHAGSFTASAVIKKTITGALSGPVPTLVGSASATRAWSTGSNITIATPTGTVDGDLMLAILSSDPQTTTRVITPPSGWTLLSQIQAVGGDFNYNNS